MEERSCSILYRDTLLVEDRYLFQILLLDKPLEDAYRPLEEYPDTYVAYQPSRLSGAVAVEV